MKLRTPLIRLIADSREHWAGLIGLVLLMFASGILKSLAANFFGRAVDYGAAAEFGLVASYGIFAVLMYAADGARLAVFNGLSPRVMDMMFVDIRMNMFRALVRSEMSAYEKSAKQGDILSRVTQDLFMLHRLFAERACWLISVLGRGLIALAFCLAISWKLALVYIVLLPLVIIMMDRLGKPLQAYQKKASQLGGTATSVLTEIMANIQVVKSFSAEPEMKRRFAEAVNRQRDELNESEKRGMLLTLMGYLADILQLALIFLLGAFYVSMGELSVGGLVAFITMTVSIREMFSLAQLGVESVRKASALAGRVYEVLNLPPESKHSGTVLLCDTKEPSHCVPEIDVDMRELRFSYGVGAPVLRGITLQLARGQRVAFVGPSGCGKSTLVKLICQYYRSFEGELTLFGQKAQDAPEDWVRGQIALVSQQPYLFRGSIADNVRYGKMDATDAEVEQALRDVRLWEFVQTLSDGINTDIGDYGARLSGGQRQRVAIARTLVRDAKLILLDEATSALDMQVEKEILSTLDGLFQGKTVITIAHRFAAVRGADYVFCIEDGKISEQGTIQQLLAEDGYLSRIALAQEAR